MVENLMDAIKAVMTGLVAISIFAIPAARAAGEMGEAGAKDEGAHFFGFVKDANGKPVDQAKVTAEIKNGIKYVTHTTKNGLYKFGGFNKSVTADDVTISCSKDKFRQARIIRKTPAKAKAVKSVETECRLQPE
jgi:hypothetical protein